VTQGPCASAAKDGKKWCAQVAADMYKGPMKKALEREFPGRMSWTVLEDNDPSGFRSRAGLAAKKASKIVSFEIPKRSPDLNVCDYSLWAEVNRRMRLQEKRMKPNKRETRADFKARLRRTALRLPKTFVDSAMRQMRIWGFGTYSTGTRLSKGSSARPAGCGALCACPLPQYLPAP
jgi:hypothetical protein